MKEAGFDGVLIHAGHGWLLHQFLSARTNLRRDEFGGSLENRAKFPISLIKKVREKLGKDFIIEIRVSGSEVVPGGMDVEETAEFCRMVEPYADIIHVSVGLYRNPVLSGQFSSMYQPRALNADMAAVIKKNVKIPVAVVGGIMDPILADSIIAEGKCDIVALARPATAEPNFANKVASNRYDDITQCIRCYKCFPGELEDNLDKLDSLFGCTVNPNAFFYDEALLNRQTKVKKHVLVIGGGVAGMEAAITAHDKGHDVTLLEEDNKLGGLVNFADNDVYKTDLKKFKDLLVKRVQSRKINVVLGKEFTKEAIAGYKADAIVIAIGSKPVIPPIKGIENAVHALDIYNNPAFIRGNEIIVVGGGLVGCETGLNMAKTGKKVTIIEMQDNVAPDSYPMHRVGLIHEMDTLLEYRTGLKCTEIFKDGIEVLNKEGKKERLISHGVIFALGMKALSDEAEKIKSCAAGLETYIVGDCVKAAKVFDAVRQAFIAGLSV
jgi:thioredoxin reductase